jgi:hypothetical protein
MENGIYNSNQISSLVLGELAITFSSEGADLIVTLLSALLRLVILPKVREDASKYNKDDHTLSLDIIVTSSFIRGVDVLIPLE